MKQPYVSLLLIALACLVGLWCSREGFRFKKSPPTKPNSAPVLQALVASPSSVPPGVSLTISAYAYDPDNDPLTYQWTLPKGWTVLSGLGTSSVTLSAPFSYGTTDQVSVIVEDTGGKTARGSLVISTFTNLPPFFVGISVALAITTYTIRADLTATAKDPEGDPLTFTWRVGGVPFTSSQGPQALWMGTNVPNTYLITATATDPYGNSATGSLTIQIPSVHIWPQYQYNIYNTGLSPYLFSQNTGALYWSFTTGNTMAWDSPVIAADGTIYIGNQGGTLYAINPDGSLKWQFPTGDIIRVSPTIDADGTIYFGTQNFATTIGTLYALNPDGTVKWTYPVPSPSGIAGQSGVKVWLDGTLYFSNYAWPTGTNHRIYALYPDGSVKWTFPTDGYMQTALGLGPDGTLYSGAEHNKYYALNPDGTLKWKFTMDSWAYPSPTIGMDGTMYGNSLPETGAVTPTLTAFNPDGSVKWSFDYGADNASLCGPAIGLDGTIYTTNQKGIYALNPEGSVRWKNETINAGAPSLSSPVVGPDGSVIVGFCFGLTLPGERIYLFNPDGSVKWVFPIGDIGNQTQSTPAIGADGTIYIGSYNGRLYAIR